MGKFLGIDLGTTFSAMATVDDAGRPIILHNKDGQNITPSMVEIDADEKAVLVGELAREGFGIRGNVVGRFKLDMGTDRVYEVEGKKYTPTDLSAFVLKKLVDEAKESLGDDISDAVVTIPANFAKEAREATISAAKKAGLEAKHIINEPTAAALYYATTGDLSNGRYVVFDLGGGTFDVSIIKLANNEVDVVTSNGVAKLGGDDFDKALQKHVQNLYKKETGKDLDKRTYTLNEAEKDKKALSSRKKCIASEIKDVDIYVTRDDYEELISEYIAQMTMLCEATLAEADLQASDINEVLLVGGSTRAPSVQSAVEKVFGKKPIAKANVDEVVALGAAFYAMSKGDDSDLTPLQKGTKEGHGQIKECNNMNYGTFVMMPHESGVDAKQNDILIPKNAKIPFTVTKDYVTYSDGQTGLTCEVTESIEATTDPEYVKIISDTPLDGLPPGRPAGQPVSVTFTLTDNQIMECSFEDVRSGLKKEIELKITGRTDSDDDSSVDNVDDFLVE